MDFESAFEDFKMVYDDAVCAIIKLREQAQGLREMLDEIIDSCENIENEF